MSPHLPTASPDDVAALDGVGGALRAAGTAVDGARSRLAAGWAASGWSGAAADAARARGQADTRMLSALGSSIATAAALVAVLRATVAQEAAVLVALEGGLRQALERVGSLPSDLTDALRRASTLGGWDGTPWHGIALPPGGALAWHDVAGLLRGHTS